MIEFEEEGRLVRRGHTSLHLSNLISVMTNDLQEVINYMISRMRQGSITIRY